MLAPYGMISNPTNLTVLTMRLKDIKVNAKVQGVALENIATLLH